MKLVIEFEAEGLRGQDISTPLMLLMESCGSGFEFDLGETGDVSGLTPDGRELRIEWRVV